MKWINPKIEKPPHNTMMLLELSDPFAKTWQDRVCLAFEDWRDVTDISKIIRYAIVENPEKS